MRINKIKFVVTSPAVLAILLFQHTKNWKHFKTCLFLGYREQTKDKTNRALQVMPVNGFNAGAQG